MPHLHWKCSSMIYFPTSINRVFFCHSHNAGTLNCFPLCTSGNRHLPQIPLQWYLLWTTRWMEKENENSSSSGTSSSSSCRSHLTLWDICNGVSISSNMAPFTLEPLRLASWRSHPDKSQFCKAKQDSWSSSDLGWNLVPHKVISGHGRTIFPSIPFLKHFY